MLFRLSGLRGMWAIIEGGTLLPPAALQDLTAVDIKYDDDLGWLEGFRGALGGLGSAWFRTESERIGDLGR